MMRLFMASLALLLTFGFHETTVVEPSMNPASPPVIQSLTPPIVDCGNVVTPGCGPKVIPDEVSSKLAAIPSLLASKVGAIHDKINQPIVVPHIPVTPVTVNVPDCLIAIPMSFKDGVKYVAVKSNNILQQSKAQAEATLAKIKANILTAIANMKKKQVAVGKILLKPVVIVGAAGGSIAGKKLEKVGSKLDFIGDKLSLYGGLLQKKGQILNSKSKKVLVKSLPQVKVIPSVKTFSLSIPVVEVVSLAKTSTGCISTECAIVAQGSSPDETVVDRPVRNTEEEHVHMGDLLKLVESLSLQDCVLRVICELNCDHDSFGKSGLSVYNSLVRFEVSGAAKGEETLIYREAALKGRNLRKPPRDCGKCSESYTNCNANSTDLIRIASRIQFH